MPDAAGPLYLIQSFANMISAVDLLDTREEAAAWFRAEGLLRRAAPCAARYLMDSPGMRRFRPV
jgi:hypothetical protein